MKFWDSSAIVPLLIDQGASAERRALLSSDPHMAAWWLTPVECVSAMTREMRAGSMSQADFALARKVLAALVNGWIEVQPSNEVRSLAERLLRVHPLRTADALQLAAALIACEHRPETFDFACADARLAEAAQKEGFNVI